MKITEVRIKLMEGSEDRLRAFCSITIDQSFVVRDLKIIDGSHGPFVAMPSRKLTGHCNRCGSKNHLRATFCNQCGAKLQNDTAADAPQKLYADVAHPINSECREMIQNAVIDEFQAELQRSAQPNYRSRYDDEFDAGDYDEADYSDSSVASTVSPGAAALADRVPPTGPTAGSSTGPTAPPLSVDEPRRTQQASGGQIDSFGAGLFEDSTSIEESGSHPSKDLTEDDDAIVIRSERGVQNRLPQPHFHDRPGGVTQPLVTNNPNAPGRRVKRDVESGRSSDSANPDDVSETDATDNRAFDDPGFGAGIFDD